MNKQAIIEGVKQLLRVALVAVIPVAIAQLQSENGIDWQIIGVTAAIAVLMGVDKYLHKTDESIVPIKGATGLTGF